MEIIISLLVVGGLIAFGLSRRSKKGGGKGSSKAGTDTKLR